MLLYLSITGISLSLILFYFNARNYKSSIYLSIFFFLISLYGINQYALLYSGSVQLVSLIYTNITFLHYLIGPMLYFYIRSIIRDHSRLTKNDILHFIPSVIFLIAALPYILSPYSHKVEIAKSLIEVPGFLMSYKVTFLSDLLSVPFMYLSRPLSVSLYTLWSIGMFIPYLSKSRASEVFSGQFFMIKWLTALLGFTFLLSTTSFLLIFNTFLRSYHNLFYSVNALLILSAIGLTGLLVSPFLSPSILYGLPRFDTTRSEPEAEPQLEEDRKSREQNFESNYLLLIAEKIRSVICESQPYLETDLNLPKFASYIEVPPHHLAYYFREVKKQTFNDFATSISAGPADESSQVVTFLVFNDNNSLFTVQPALSDTGILTYTPANGKSGTARVTVQLMDDGGTQNGGNDTSAAQSFTITLTPLPDAPSSIGVQNFCGSATVANLTASAPIGANVRWYAAASGGNVLPGTNILVPNTTYYAESFNSTTGCISARKAVVASIIALPAAPTGIAIQNFCLNSTVKDLVATAPTGSIVKWYASDGGGTELPASTLLVTNTSYYAESVNMTTGCVSASRTVISAVQYPPPALPNADAVQYFCGSAMVANLVASASNGTTVRWFATATGGMALSDATLLTTNNTYYAESVSNLSGCISTSRTPVLVTIYQNPDVPSAVSAQFFCGSANVSNLAATAPNGSILRWYATATGGTPLAATTALVSNTTYYVESVNSTTGCVSARITVLVTLLELPAAPTGSTIQNFCGSPTVKDLTAYAPTGSIVKWYAAVKGGTELPASTPLVFDTPYFAESVNTTTGCASATRTVIVAAVYPPPAPPLADAVQNFCGSATLANIKATLPTSVDMKWYTVATGGTAIPLTTVLTTGTYYAEAISNVTGCISTTRTAVKVNINAYPDAPIAAASQVFCGGATLANLSVTPAAGTTVYWYTAATGGTVLDNSTTLITATRYYAEAINSTSGCISLTRTAVTATVNALPGAPAGNASQNFCTENAPKVSSLTVTGTNIVWYNAATGGTVVDATTALVNGSTYYAGQTVNGCTSSARLAVSAVVQTCNTPPPPANKPPVVSDISKMINMNQTLAFTQNDFTGAYTDADKDVMVNIRIESVPLHGKLLLNGIEVVPGTILMLSDLSRLVFKPDLDYYGNTSFRWIATDGKDYANASATVYITINKLDLFIPQGFSPNGDGIDDYFIIKGAERYIVTLRIFNRWGNKVYESDHYKNDWDGVSNVGILISYKLPTGTYYYTANFNNGDKEIIGYLTINR